MRLVVKLVLARSFLLFFDVESDSRCKPAMLESLLLAPQNDPVTLDAEILETDD